MTIKSYESTIFCFFSYLASSLPIVDYLLGGLVLVLVELLKLGRTASLDLLIRARPAVLGRAPLLFARDGLERAAVCACAHRANGKAAGTQPKAHVAQAGGGREK